MPSLPFPGLSQRNKKREEEQLTATASVGDVGPMAMRNGKDMYITGIGNTLFKTPLSVVGQGRGYYVILVLVIPLHPSKATLFLMIHFKKVDRDPSSDYSKLRLVFLILNSFYVCVL